MPTFFLGALRLGSWGGSGEPPIGGGNVGYAVASPTKRQKGRATGEHYSPVAPPSPFVTVVLKG